jgi:hypothetical protein
VAGSVPVLHPEAQTVDEMLAGWRKSATVRRLGSWHDRGALLDVLAAIKTVPRQTSNELACPCELSNSPCLYLTAESDSASLLPTRKGRMPVPSGKYGRFEYGGLPVNLCVRYPIVTQSNS